MTINTAAFTPLLVNLDHKLAVRIDIAPIHSRGVKRQSDVALAVDRDQPTRRQLEACEELINYLRKRCGKIDAHYAVVRPHREVNPPQWATDCPGNAFPYSWFRKFQE